MFCPKCGKNISDDAKFCPECGNSIGNFPTSTDQPIAQTSQMSPPTQKKRGGCLKPVLIVVGIIVVFGVIGSALGGGGDTSSSSTKESTSAHPVSSLASSSKKTELQNEYVESKAVKEPEKNEADSKPSETMGQKNALAKAKSYLSISAFSYSSLVDQLEFEKFSHEDAVYAADNCGADWDEQAAKKAKSYLELTSFSRDSLIEQLEFEGFTHEQAVYGVDANGY